MKKFGEAIEKALNREISTVSKISGSCTNRKFSKDLKPLGRRKD